MPPINPCSLAKAIMEPVSVTTPMARDRGTQTKLLGGRRAASALLKRRMAKAASTLTSRSQNACVNAQKRGREKCPCGSLPAAEIERFVVDQIRCIGRDPGLVAETITQARCQAEERSGELESEKAKLGRELRRRRAVMRELLAGENGEAGGAEELRLKIQDAEIRQTEIREEILALRKNLFDRDEVAAALGRFEPIWESLNPRERLRLFELLIRRVTFDGENVAITLHPTGIRVLADQYCNKELV